MSFYLSPFSPLRSMASTIRSAGRFNSTAPTTATSAAMQTIQSPSTRSRYTARPAPRRQTRQQFAEQQRAAAESKSIERFQTREWKAGDIYAPHDLSPAEMKKWKTRGSPNFDAFDALKLNPLDVYKNFSIMSEYITPMGRIKHRKITGLRGVNQRKVAKAIRRAIGIGIMPSVHRHPEVLATEAKWKMEGTGF
ncbi:ribosomal protein S18 [Aspergillus californicus]